MQERLRQHGSEVVQLLSEGAHLYICGDAGGMAREVHKILLKIICDERGTSNEDAASFVQELRSSNRLQVRYRLQFLRISSPVIIVQSPSLFPLVGANIVREVGCLVRPGNSGINLNQSEEFHVVYRKKETWSFTVTGSSHLDMYISRCHSRDKMMQLIFPNDTPVL